MALFQKNHPEKSLQRDRDAAKANVDRLANSLTAAEDHVISAKRSVQAHALDGNDAGLDAAEQAEAAALRRMGTIETAFGEAERILAKLDGQIAAASEKTLRAATAAETNALADDLIQAAAGFDIAIRVLDVLAERAARVVFEGNGLASFSTLSKVEVPEAISVISERLREHAEKVLDGTAAATLPGAEVKFVPPIPTKPITRRLFTLRSICWTNEDNMLRVAQKFTDVDLPLAAADRAIKARVCVEMNDPARNPMTHNQWVGFPDSGNCFSVDQPDDTAAVDASAQQERDDVVKHAGFVETIGRPYIVRTAAGGVA